MSNQGTVQLSQLNNMIVPVIHQDFWHEYSGPLQPNVLMQAGTVVGRVTSASQADVQTVTFSATPASGVWGFQVVYPDRVVQSPLIAWSASAPTALANVQAACDAVFGAGNTVVTGTYGAGFVITFAGNLATGPQPVITTYGVTLQTAAPAAVTTTVTHTTTGIKQYALAPYVSTNNDGSQVPVGVLIEYSLVGPDGTITNGNQSGNITAPKTYSARIVVAGYVDTAKLTGLDSNAVGLLGRLIDGTTSAGILAIY